MKLRQCVETWVFQENGHFSLNNGSNSSWIRNSAISYENFFKCAPPNLKSWIRPCWPYILFTERRVPVARETTRHSTCNTSWPIPGHIQYHLHLSDNAGVIGNKREIFQCNEMRGLLLKVDYCRWTTYDLWLMHIHVHRHMPSRLGYDYWWLC